MDNYGEILIYQNSEGNIKIDVHLEEETNWLTQDQMAALFVKAKSTINEHIKNVFAEGELNEKVIVRKFRITTQHGAIPYTRKNGKKAINPLAKWNLISLP
jgi:hypothetical protein